MITEKISIDGMACNHCTSSVSAALSALNGIGDVSVSLEEKSASVVYDENTLTHQAIVDVINDLGFTVVE